MPKRKKKAEKKPDHMKHKLKDVKSMDRKTYLKYYIGVLENQIREASKILKQKKEELKKLR